MPRIPVSVGPTVVGAAAMSGQDKASAITSASDLLLTSARNVRVNKSVALNISRRICDLVDVVKSELDLHPDAPWAHSEPLVKVEQALRDISVALEGQGKKSYFVQLLCSERDREALLGLAEKVRDAFTILMIHMRTEATSLATALSAQMDHMKECAAYSEETSGVGGEILARCPPSQAHYYGRVSETKAVSSAVVGELPGRVAILGGPGMGKSTLSVAVLHDPRVMQKFGPRRYFVSCESAECSASAAVAMAFGIPAADPKAARKRLQRLLGEQASLLVLDNFEAVWEASEQRADAEDMLRFLDSLEHLSLIVTLRGGERPDGVLWSRPFVAPLGPLGNAAALQTFLSIADIPEDDPSLGKLISLLDGIPLAIVLMACLAQSEPPHTLLSRWNDVHTAMVTRGQGQSRRTSLDISIQLSVSSPRMAARPAAQALLSVLALLPYGVVDTDLSLWNLGQSAHALAILTQNSLIVCGSDERIRVLAPIRAFMAAYYPPEEVAMRRVFDHYFGLAALSHSSAESAQSISSVAPEVGNISSLALSALPLGEDLRIPALVAVKDLCSLYADYGIGSAPELVGMAVSLAKEAGLDDMRADLMVQWARMATKTLAQGDPHELFTQARSLYESSGNINGALDCAIALSAMLPNVEAAAEASRLYTLAEARHDLQRMASCACHQARALGRAGKLAESRQQYELAISLARQEPGPRWLLSMMGNSQYGLAQICLQLGNERGAMLYFDEALATLETAEDTHGITSISWHLAMHVLNGGRARAAVTHAERAIKLQKHGVADLRQSVYLACILACAYACSGNLDGAGRVMERLGHIMRDVNTPLLRCQFLLTQSAISVASGNTMDARAQLIHARAVARQRDSVDSTDHLESLEAGCMEVLIGLESCPQAAVTLAVTAATMKRKRGDPLQSAVGLVYMAEVVDDAFAERLIEATLLPLQNRRMHSVLAAAHLRRARTAQQRGQLDLARHRAQNALRYFGDYVDVIRIGRAKAIIAECSTTV